MKLLVLTGSPHADGTTARLTDAFCGAVNPARHDVIRVNTASLEIHPCMRCDYCRERTFCVWDDGMVLIYESLLMADKLILVTPLYYFGMTAQLKRVLDRFYAVDQKLCRMNKEIYLLAACGDSAQWAMEALDAHIDAVCRHLNWKYMGGVLAIGCRTADDLEGTDYLRQAAALAQAV